jgi:hypothetical protein
MLKVRCFVCAFVVPDQRKPNNQRMANTLSFILSFLGGCSIVLFTIFIVLKIDEAVSWNW